MIKNFCGSSVKIDLLVLFSGDLTQTLVDRDQSHNHTALLDNTIWCVLKKDFMGIQHQIEKSFKRFENGKTIYDKKEYAYVEIMYTWR